MLLRFAPLASEPPTRSTPAISPQTPCIPMHRTMDLALIYWDKLVILLVVWSVLWYPFDVASFCLPFSALPNLSDINNVADIIFWTDLALNFVKVR